MNKQILRSEMKNKRLSLDKQEKAKMDKSITQTALDIVTSYDEVLCYVSSDIEVDTRELLSVLFADKSKTVLVPRCESKSNIMFFYPISGYNDLEKGHYGILEPKTHIRRQELFSYNSCCIVPALCYDERGYRVGFGKGFYDRFLKTYVGAKIGLCYSNCFVSQIDNDKTDIKADIIITERSVSYINERKITSDG